MPNWCDNKLYIEGTPSLIDTFLSDAQSSAWGGETGGLLSTLVPMPTALEGTTSPTPESPEPHPNWANMLASGEMTQEWYDELCAKQRDRYEQGQKTIAETGYANWYDWQLENWGTKWGDSNTHIIERLEDGSGIILHFDTPWCPPTAGLAAIAKKYPDLQFLLKWSEPGACLRGDMLFRNGEMFFNDEREMQTSFNEETGENEIIDAPLTYGEAESILVEEAAMWRDVTDPSPEALRDAHELMQRQFLAYQQADDMKFAYPFRSLLRTIFYTPKFGGRDA